MDYERKDSNYKAKHGKEPQKLHYTMSAGKPAMKKLSRKEMLFKAMKESK